MRDRIKQILKGNKRLWTALKYVYFKMHAIPTIVFRLMENKTWQYVDSLKAKYQGIQLTTEELVLIFKAIQRHMNCHLLVFGLGNDTPLWLEMNQNGQTIFLEDNKEWFERMTSLNPQAKAYLVHYSTQRTQWKELLDHPENLQMQLPEQVAQTRWDVILVDGPAGYTNENPGRMQSIYTASKLISKGGCVFVHDCHREVEQIYSNKYLLKKNFVPHILINSALRQYAFK